MQIKCFKNIAPLPEMTVVVKTARRIVKQQELARETPIAISRCKSCHNAVSVCNNPRRQSKSHAITHSIYPRTKTAKWREGGLEVRASSLSWGWHFGVSDLGLAINNLSPNEETKRRSTERSAAELRTRGYGYTARAHHVRSPPPSSIARSAYTW